MKTIPKPGQAWPGDCKACGQELVKNEEGRVYHTVDIFVDGDICPALMEIPGTDSISAYVPMECFIPWETNPYKENKDGGDTSNNNRSR